VLETVVHVSASCVKRSCEKAKEHEKKRKKRFDSRKKGKEKRVTYSEQKVERSHSTRTHKLVICHTFCRFDIHKQLCTMSRFKVVVVGDEGAGKTAYCNRIRTGIFSSRYDATLGVDVNPLCVNTLSGNSGARTEEIATILNIWDVAGSEKYKGLGKGYFIGAHAAIVMFDVSLQSSLASVPKWVQKLQTAVPNIPIVICGNKADLVQHMQLSSSQIDQVIKRLKVPYVNISAKSNLNVHVPILTLLQQLFHDNCLKLVESAFVFPPKLKVSHEHMEARATTEGNGHSNKASTYDEVDKNAKESYKDQDNKEEVKDEEVEVHEENDQRLREEQAMEDTWDQVTRLRGAAAPPSADHNVDDMGNDNNSLINEHATLAVQSGVIASRAMARVKNIVSHLAGELPLCSASVAP
jgi:GTP-binding nuclear protein Ran